jgi:adenine-specific DNA glycosylase
VLWPLAIVRRGKKILLRRREAGGLLGGLWELPGGELTGGASMAALLRGILGDLGSALPRRRKLGTVRHAITYRRIVAPVYLFEFAAESAATLPRSRWRWVHPGRIGALATSSMTAKACRLLAP